MVDAEAETTFAPAIWWRLLHKTAIPYPGQQWCPAGHPARYPHEHVRNGTAKLLTLFHPASGAVRVKGITSCHNAVLHGWLQTELTTILAALPSPPVPVSAQENRANWERWQEGLAERLTLKAELPPLRMLLVLDNLAGHKTASFVCWLFDHGIMPLYTPLGGSWLNMTESVQRILKQRGLAGQHPTTVGEIIAALEAAAQGWNAAPTPFVWGGRRPQTQSPTTPCSGRFRSLYATTASALAFNRPSTMAISKSNDPLVDSPLVMRSAANNRRPASGQRHRSRKRFVAARLRGKAGRAATKRLLLLHPDFHTSD